MSVADVIEARAITEVVHFTTNHGCLGTLFRGSLLSRARLEDDEMVKYLFSANAELRRDTAYIDHISLSIEHINTQFYRVSANNWHRDEPIFWCILGFDPAVLTHDDVVFATTNNIYTSVLRGSGEAALERLFQNPVVRWQGNSVARLPATRPSYPTCFQAEALYPGSLSTEFLQRIYVRSAMDQSEIIGFLKATFHREIDVVIAPEKFEFRPD